ncbi:amidohydrolase family protein [Stygiolobus caldivivus]|uniref:Amidohydrolase n=1 Tax=Stygiolobus caldivivus TaxID=2824673 RepID=A0A8D5U9M7_9CREN|nr:amidohydrolase family protein [Stygiolobus caldivivus]BCU71600.1 amidohydrolase [Stygiolobus caldivivus]
MIIKNAVNENGEKINIIIDEGSGIINKVVKGDYNDNHDDNVLDLGGRFISPGLVDSHAHIDSNFLLDVCKEVDTPKFTEALRSLIECKENLTEDEIYRLAKKSMDYYIMHGTLFIRSHVMIDGRKWRERVKSLIRLREEFKDKVYLQIIGFVQSYDYFDTDQEERVIKSIEMGIDGIGGQPHLQPSREDGIYMIKRLFDIAEQYNMILDFHADYADEPDLKFSEVVVSEAIKRKLYGKVSLSHLIAMHSYYEDYAHRLMRWIKNADINIIISPITEMQGSGAHENYPKRRGIPRVRDLLEEKINVSLGHDDIQNHLNPIGDGDLLKASFALMIGDYMFFTRYFKQILQMMTYNGAKSLRIENYGLEEGKKANLVIFNTKNLKDTLIQIPSERMVIANGKVIFNSLKSVTV